MGIRYYETRLIILLLPVGTPDECNVGDKLRDLSLDPEGSSHDPEGSLDENPNGRDENPEGLAVMVAVPVPGSRSENPSGFVE
jgi:hypothetical protein